VTKATSNFTEAVECLLSFKCGADMLHGPNSLQGMRSQVMNAHKAAAEAQGDMESVALRQGWGLRVLQKGVIRQNKVRDSLQQKMPRASDEKIIEISRLLEAFAHGAPLAVQRTTDPEPVFRV
jgi:hypothetical protein